jgi:hypothetical protein
MMTDFFIFRSRATLHVALHLASRPPSLAKRFVAERELMKS